MRSHRFHPALRKPGALPRARVRHVPGTMNKTEARYAADVLSLRRMDGEVIWFEFEPMKFHLGNRCWFEPDFGLLMADRSVEFHEVKAWWPSQGKAGIEEDARAKLQVAASLFPFFKFVIAAEERARGVTLQWHYEEIATAGAPL